MFVVGSMNLWLFAGIVEQNKDDAMSKRPMTALILSTYRLVTANGCSWIDVLAATGLVC